MSSTLATFVMTAYNSAEFIEKSIHSVLNQTIKDFEFIIVDDASTDNTLALIESIKDSRIHLIRNEKNLHVAGAANEGMKHVETKYALRIDSDDLCVPTRLEKELKFMEGNPETGICGSYIRFFGDRKSTWEMPTENYAIKARLLFDNCFANSSVILRMDVLKENGLFPLPYSSQLNHPPAEDYELAVKLIKLTKMANIPEVLVSKREYAKSQSALFKERRYQQLVKFSKQMFDLFDFKVTDEELSWHCFDKHAAPHITINALHNINHWNMKVYEHFHRLPDFSSEAMQETIDLKWKQLFPYVNHGSAAIKKEYFEIAEQRGIRIRKQRFKTFINRWFIE